MKKPIGMLSLSQEERNKMIFSGLLRGIRMRFRKHVGPALAIAVLMAIGRAHASDAVRPGELMVERPTLQCLGFEWRIAGDQNGNATCSVSCREAGTGKWRDSLPLYRTGLGQTIQLGMLCPDATYQLPEAMIGSILDLSPGREYEIKLTLNDPDGVEGPAVRELRLKTRAEPGLPAGKEVRHVYPKGWAGQKEKPNFIGLMHAINGYPPRADCYQTIHPNAAKPGTVIKMHGGTYQTDRFGYWTNDKFQEGPNEQYWLHGTATFTAKGTPEAPIYIVPAGDGEVIIDGAGCHNLFNVRAADYLHFEGLTIRNTEIAFHAGFQGERGGGMKGLTVKNCWMEGVTYGVLAQDGRSEDFYIADNVIIGCNPPDELGRFDRTKAGYAVVLAGQGHVVCHNYAANFWDGINVFTSSLADPQYGQQSRAIDFYNNDIFNVSDNFIEADGGYANIRILRNRCFNCVCHPLSTQPVHVGPVYWIRNIVWNADGGLMAIKDVFGAPVFLYLHNTSSTHMKLPLYRSRAVPGKSTVIVQNNVSVGPLEKNAVVHLLTGNASPDYRISHNAYRTNVPSASYAVGSEKYSSLAALRQATGHEKCSVEVDYRVFANAAEPPHTKRRSALVFPDDVDLHPRAEAPIIDAGTPIPGVNDLFSGAAPDIGAVEHGLPEPVYGPRLEAIRERLKAWTQSVRAKVHP